MVLNTLTLSFNHSVLSMVFFIKPHVLIPLNRMVFLRGNTGMLLKEALLFFTNLIFLLIFGLMLLLLLPTLLIDCLLQCQVFILLGRNCSLNHHLFMLLRLLGVLAILFLGILTRTSYNLGLNLVFFLVTLLCLKGISVLILPLTNSILLVMFCLTRLFFLLLMILILPILIFLFLHLCLLGFPNLSLLIFLQ